MGMPSEKEHSGTFAATGDYIWRAFAVAGEDNKKKGNRQEGPPNSGCWTSHFFCFLGPASGSTGLELNLQRPR